MARLGVTVAVEGSGRGPDAGLCAPPGKTPDNFDFGRLPGLSEPLVRVPAKGGDWIDDGHNIVVLGPPGTGKSHLAPAIRPRTRRAWLPRPLRPSHRLGAEAPGRPARLRP